MRNTRSYGKTKSLVPTVGSQAYYAWLGYQDAWSCSPFSSEYETWRDDQQRNYERGRLVVAAFRGLRRPIPEWRRTQSLKTALFRDVAMQSDLLDIFRVS